MTKPDYTELDAAILEAVKDPQVRHPAWEIYQAGRVRELCERAEAMRSAARRLALPDPYNVMVARLQALRRAGKIEHHHSMNWQRRQP